MRFLAWALVSVLFASGCASRNKSGVAVVELFTSQGCSMCPEADKHLSDLIHEAEADSQRVYGLSFHVDYWDKRGWKDPNSKHANTERQNRYSMLLNTGGMYTPEMVVNGTTEFVGSDRKAAKAAIKESLDEAPEYEIAISGFTLVDSTLQFSYQLNGNPEEGDVVNVAVVQQDVENFVPRGENEGRTLHHDNVVKVFESDTLKRQGHYVLHLPEMDLSKGRLILFVQNRKWQVQGAVMKRFM